MRFSIVTFGGYLLPAVWPADASTEQDALEEAKAMYASRLGAVPGLLIDWETKSAKRLVVSDSGDSGEIYDNAGELFGIATTSEHFEEIANARNAEIDKMEQSA